MNRTVVPDTLNVSNWQLSVNGFARTITSVIATASIVTLATVQAGADALSRVDYNPPPFDLLCDATHVPASGFQFSPVTVVA